MGVTGISPVNNTSIGEWYQATCFFIFPNSHGGYWYILNNLKRKEMEKIVINGVERPNLFIHHGSDSFDPDLFNYPEGCKPITNKPSRGGLWLSPIDSERSWADWCRAWGFNEDELESSFKVRVNPDAKILVINGQNDIDKLLNHDGVIDWGNTQYDAVWLTDEGLDRCRDTTPSLYAWDCETLIVLNPEIIITERMYDKVAESGVKFLDNVLKIDWSLREALIDHVENECPRGISELTFLENIIYSINDYGADIGRILDGDEVMCGGFYYDQDSYVEVDGSIHHQDDVSYCEYNEEFTTDDVVEAHWYSARTHHHGYVSEVIAMDKFHCYNGVYYDYDSLSNSALVLAENEGGEEVVIHIDDAFYDEDMGYLTYEPKSVYRRGYHSNGSHSILFDRKTNWKIGFEVEKEDFGVLESLLIEEFEDEVDGKWRKESDSSLDDEKGFELVSPTFEFDIDKIFEYIEDNTVLVDHINAKYSDACGGHIHVSKGDISGYSLFEEMQGYTPFLYALYPKRIRRCYSLGESIDVIKKQRNRNAIHLKSYGIEYRIFPAVHNVSQLRWRAELLFLMMSNPAPTLEAGMYNVLTKFRGHLKKVYRKDNDRYGRFVERYIKYCKEFEDKDMKEFITTSDLPLVIDDQLELQLN